MLRNNNLEAGLRERDGFFSECIYQTLPQVGRFCFKFGLNETGIAWCVLAGSFGLLAGWLATLLAGWLVGWLA
jgi:hypothetical protein